MIKHKTAALLFVFVFYVGISHINLAVRFIFHHDVSATSLSDNIQSQDGAKTTIHIYRLTAATHNFSDFFDKTESTVKQIDTDKTQLKKIYFSENKQVINLIAYTPDFSVSFQPQFIQSITLFLYNRNILI
jgi:hypothetical protein